MHEAYKNVAKEFHQPSGKPSEDISLIGIFLISYIRKNL